ncbi:Xaa-Pro peptidase family protein [Desulfonatronospira sp.]|uniref:M24 family metallopeptidase n=1 Tax=Desulfonatronospira sp. TaxID=1962951 RepID=UPI0025B8EA71|nr:Xaa-Pro peptidase family protein [Desulfonatronospira sp.]
MFESLEKLPLEEMQSRVKAFKNNIIAGGLDCGAVMIFSRLNIYYFTGSFGNGLLWIPMQGEPVFLCRKGLQRFSLESPLERVVAFRSFGQLPDLLSDFGLSVPDRVGAEKMGLPWALAESLQKRLSGPLFASVDQALALTRMVKTPWEAEKMLLCGQRHHQALYHVLPGMITPGMTERDISMKVWECFFQLGHQGLMRMQNYGEEIFLGHVAAGDSANYPSVFNGPVGLRGEHPAITQMGYAGKVWQEDEPLTLDCGFALEGYQTDKTQVYLPRSWSPPEQVIQAHELCIRIQEEISSRLRPGCKPSELYLMAIEMAEKENMSEGFMGLGGNKVPFLGHGIGLAVDEFPPLAKGFDHPLQENMFLAVEPKIGIPGKGMVGVENTFRVTPQGGTCITGDNFDPVRI